MGLLNYSTTVDASKSQAEIAAALGKTPSVMEVATTYANGRAVGIRFALATEYGHRSFVLPVDVDGVYRVMVREQAPPRYRNRDQAERVAWRILKDWVEAQMALVSVGLAAMDQVMLPYMQVGDTGETVYGLYQSQQLALEAGS